MGTKVVTAGYNVWICTGPVLWYIYLASFVTLLEGYHRSRKVLLR